MVRNTKNRFIMILSNDFVGCFQKCFLAIFLFLFTTTSLAQDKLAKQDSNSNYQQFKRFKFLKPDESFDALIDSSGYFNSLLKSSIKYITIPGNYVAAVNEFKNLTRTKNTRVIEMSTVRTETKKVFKIIQEESAPAGSGFENYISLYVIVPYDEWNTLVVIGAYPKSQDKNLQQKFIACALTIRPK